MEKLGAAVLVCFYLAGFVGAQDDRITEVRFRSRYGSHLGRVEVRYNDTWGAICGNGWNYNSAKVACRSAGFVTAVCAATQPAPTSPAIPFWMTNLNCRGWEPSLSRCRFRGFAGVNGCSYVGATVCADRSVVGKATNLVLLRTTAVAARIQWTLPTIPEGVVHLRWVVFQYGRSQNRYINSRNVNITQYAAYLAGLRPNSTYTVQVRTDVKYALCNGWLFGNVSDNFTFQTTIPLISNYSMRLVSPWPRVNFLGRVEVKYNGTWGTVCHDAFSVIDGSVICRMAGFTVSRCSIRSALYGRGTGPIWLDNLNCGIDDTIIEECSHRGWGKHNCHHREDVGVICQPSADDPYLQPPSGLQVDSINFNSIRLSWTAFQFPPNVSIANYIIRYRISRPFQQQLTSARNTQYSLNNLVIGVNYSISVRARYRFFGCSYFFYTQVSQSVLARTVERAPSGPPTSLHVVPLNSTAIEVQWNKPLLNLRNGRIRGFKVFYRVIDSASDQMISIANPSATEVIIGRLKPSTFYSFSVLAYTVADGLRSGYLTAPTYEANFTELIIRFGPNQNGKDRFVVSTIQTDLEVYCGSGMENISLNWLYPNLTLVSSINYQFRQIKYPNDRNVVLHIARRNVEYCDAGVYVCEAKGMVNGKQITQRRNFTLLVGDSPPTPSIPYPIAAKSTQITIGWYELDCDGGHNVSELVIQYREVKDSDLMPTYENIYNIEASRKEYTVYNLEPETNYGFAVQAVSSEFAASSFSDERIVSTLIAAPSAPMDVSVRLIKSPVVQVSWKEPADHYGIIKTYIVYALAPNVTLATNLNRKLQLSWENSVNVSGHVGAINITVAGSHSYVQFQVSAVIEVDDTEIEGKRSAVTDESTVFVPVSDLPVPTNVRVKSVTNTSVTITWSYPSPGFHVPFNYFEISYHGTVEWRSPDMNLVQFREAGTVSVPSTTTSVHVRYLTPSTRYTFGVSVVTVSFGNGRSIQTEGETSIPTGEKLAYFQLKVTTQKNCYAEKLDPTFLPSIRDSLLETYNTTLCKHDQCELSPDSVQLQSMTCDNSLINRKQAFIRGRAKGGRTIGAGDMVSLMEIWVLSETAMVTAHGVSLAIASDCPVPIDNLSQLQTCSSVPTVATTTASTPKFEATLDETRTDDNSEPNFDVTPPTTEMRSLPNDVGFGAAAKRVDDKQSGSSNQVTVIAMSVVFCLLIIVLIVIIVVLVVIVVRQNGIHRSSEHFSFRKSTLSDEAVLVQKGGDEFSEEYGVTDIDGK